MPIVGGEQGIGIFPTVANYSALPAANTVAGKTYVVLNSQGTRWLGTFYSKGLYYSDGTDWVYTETPLVANLIEMDAGLNQEKYGTPFTIANLAKWNNFINKDGSVALTANWNAGNFSITAGSFVKIGGTSSEFLKADGSVDSNSYITSTFYTFSTGLTDTANTITVNLSTGVNGGQTAIGGTGIGDALTYKSTTGNGTATVAGHVFTGGNNGATTIMSLYNNGNVNIGTASSTNQRLLRVGLSTNIVDIGTRVTGGEPCIYMGSAAPTSTNYRLLGFGTTTILNALSGGAASIRVEGVVVADFNANNIHFTPAVATSGSSDVFLFTTPASTGQTAGSETMGFDINMSATITHASNTVITLNRDMIVQARTHAFTTSGGVITDAATLYITGAPIAGTNATITNATSLWIPSGKVNIGVASRTNQRLLRIGQDSAIIDIGSYTASTGTCAIYFGATTPGATNYGIAGTTNITIVNAGSTGGEIDLRINNNDNLALTIGRAVWTVQAVGSGSNSPYFWRTPASINLTAGAETIGFEYDMSTSSVQHASNTAITSNRDFLIRARTHTFVSATGTITTAATLAVTGAPTAGTNAAITRPIAAWIQSGETLLGGSIAPPIVAAKTGNYTATSADFTIPCDATSASFTVTLPAAADCTSRLYCIKKIDSTGNTITIDGNGSETIDGSTTQTLDSQWEAVIIQSNGSNWYIISVN
jgi:hypothetical protein